MIYSGTFEEHLFRLETTFQVLLDNHFVLKLTKFFFAQPQVEYLGHVVSHQGVQSVDAKVVVIQHWPVPKSTKAVRSFLGLAGFYRHFIKGYATIVAPLVKLTTLDHFQWTTEAQTTFEQLKQALSDAPVLALPNFELPFTVETKDSGVGMGAVLSKRGHPITFFSKPLSLRLLQASTYVHELFVITSAVKK